MVDRQPRRAALRPADLVVRCWTGKRDQLWLACCIDFNLAAQADSRAEAKRKLNSQILEYIEEAVTVDSDHADSLLHRSAPWYEVVQWEFRYALQQFRKHRNAARGEPYKSPLPMVPSVA